MDKSDEWIFEQLHGAPHLSAHFIKLLTQLNEIYGSRLDQGNGRLQTRGIPLPIEHSKLVSNFFWRQLEALKYTALKEFSKKKNKRFKGFSLESQVQILSLRNILYKNVRVGMEVDAASEGRNLLVVPFDSKDPSGSSSESGVSAKTDPLGVRVSACLKGYKSFMSQGISSLISKV